jgi:hypothetical protein
MNIIPLIALFIIWASALYGFLHDDMGIGVFGRCFAALAHGAIAALFCTGFGALCYATVLVIREIL